MSLLQTAARQASGGRQQAADNGGEAHGTRRLGPIRSVLTLLPLRRASRTPADQDLVTVTTSPLDDDEFTVIVTPAAGSWNDCPGSYAPQSTASPQVLVVGASGEEFCTWIGPLPLTVEESTWEITTPLLQIPLSTPYGLRDSATSAVVSPVRTTAIFVPP